MKGSLLAYLLIAAQLATAVTVNAQQAADPRAADLVRIGKLRVGLFLPQYTKDPATGEIEGVVYLVETARALAARLGVKVQLVEYPTPTKAMEGLNAGACDVAFMGAESSRAGEIGFSPTIFELDYTYLVPAGSSIRRIADADRPGIRIAVVRNHASTLTLSRVVKHAELVYADTPGPTFDLLRTGRADVFASVGFVLQGFSTQLPGSRVLEERYGVNHMAMAVAKGRDGWLAYVSEFVEEAKASGLAQRAVERSGLRGLHVAPPASK